MDSNLTFSVKVLAISGVLAFVIKYGASQVVNSTLPATETVLAYVFLPSLMMAMILSWRAWSQRPRQD